MQTQKTYGSGILTTINPSKIGAQGTDWQNTAWRPMQWLYGEIDENFQQDENDENEYALYTLISGQRGPDLVNPSGWWRVENRLATNSHLVFAMAAADTYIDIAEPGLYRAGYDVHMPQSGQHVMIVDVDPTYANGWTNLAGDACNMKLDRTLLSGPTGVSAAALTQTTAGVPVMGELGEPKEGIFTVPGDPMYNLCQNFGLYVSMSNMQRNSLMSSDYGTNQQLVQENESMLSRMVQQTILTGFRGSVNDSDEGMIYQTNGLINQIQSNVLSVSGVGNSLTFGNISEFCDGTFESANTGSMKNLVCGETLFMNVVNTARQESKLTQEITWNPALGVHEARFVTSGGHTIVIQKMRFAFQGVYADWGLVLDLSNISYHEYAGMSWRWIFNLENPMQAITKQTDAIVGSLMVTIKDPDTCGVIRGGVEPLVANRTDLGVIREY